MRKTIAEQRVEQVNKLYKRNESLGRDNASRLMNSFYRYVGLRIRNVEDDNNERTANTKWHKANEDREEKWLARLERQFKEYGLILVFYGIYPTITEHVGENETIYTYYYND